MRVDPFCKIAHATVANTPIIKLLEVRKAVVLERIAMGAGATNWYYCGGISQLAAVEAQLSPGSVASFYFDARIRDTLYTPAQKLEMEKIITETGDVVLGLLRDDGLHIEVDFVVSAGQLREATSQFSSATRVFYGAFPGPDNDGNDAVTVALPDADGIVRPHPHSCTV